MMPMLLDASQVTLANLVTSLSRCLRFKTRGMGLMRSPSQAGWSREGHCEAGGHCRGVCGSAHHIVVDTIATWRFGCRCHHAGRAQARRGKGGEGTGGPVCHVTVAVVVCRMWQGPMAMRVGSVGRWQHPGDVQSLGVVFNRGLGAVWSAGHSMGACSPCGTPPCPFVASAARPIVAPHWLSVWWPGARLSAISGCDRGLWWAVNGGWVSWR